MTIFNQWKYPECKGYSFITAISIMDSSLDFKKMEDAINEDYKWLLTNRSAWEFFKKRWFIKDYEDVPRLKAKALLNKWVPLIATVVWVDWDITSKAPYIAKFRKEKKFQASHSICVIDYDSNNRMLTIQNTWWEDWGDNWCYYLHADELDKVTQFCRIIL